MCSIQGHLINQKGCVFITTSLCLLLNQTRAYLLSTAHSLHLYSGLAVLLNNNGWYLAVVSMLFCVAEEKGHHERSCLVLENLLAVSTG